MGNERDWIGSKIIGIFRRILTCERVLRVPLQATVEKAPSFPVLSPGEAAAPACGRTRRGQVSPGGKPEKKTSPEARSVRKILNALGNPMLFQHTEAFDHDSLICEFVRSRGAPFYEARKGFPSPAI